MLVSIDLAILGGVVVGGALLVVPIVVAGAGVAVATVDVGAVGVGDVMAEVLAPLHAARHGNHSDTHWLRIHECALERCLAEAAVSCRHFTDS